jgi:hypothetical protein
MQLEMIPCPKCCNDFPLKRKELGYHVCINCSTVKPKVAIITVEGEGDHTWNDIIIMDQDQAMAIARKAAELSGMRADLEFIDFDTEGEENEVSQSVKDTVLRINEDEEDDAPISSVEDEPQGVQGIDY